MGRCYIVNITNFTYVLWKIFKVFLDESTRNKIHLFKESYPQEVKEVIHPSQYLKKHGGQMDEPPKPWPPAMTSSVFTYNDKQLMSEDQYQEALSKNPKMLPRPDLIQKYKSTRDPNIVPPKTYYFVDRVERRNGLNEVIEVQYKNHKIDSPKKSIEDVTKQLVKESDDKQHSDYDIGAEEEKIGNPSNFISMMPINYQDRKNESEKIHIKENEKKEEQIRMPEKKVSILISEDPIVDSSKQELIPDAPKLLEQPKEIVIAESKNILGPVQIIECKNEIAAPISTNMVHRIEDQKPKMRPCKCIMF